MKTGNYNFGLMNAGNPEREMMNMRVGTRSGRVFYESVHPKKCISDEVLKPLAHVDGKGWLLTRGGNLIQGDEEYSDLRILVRDTPGEVSGVVPTEGGRLTVMCRGGSLTVDTRGEDWVCETNTKRYPSVSFRACSAGERHATVSGRQLREDAATSTLSEKSWKSVTGDFATAYERVCSEAAADGLFTAPTLVWAKYFDAEGRELLTTPAVAVLPPTTFDPWVSVGIGSGNMLEGYDVAVPVYTIEAEFGGEVCTDVARVEVYTTPEMHPYRRGGAAHVARDVQGRHLRVSLPGYGMAVTSTDTNRLIYRILGVKEMLARTAACVSRPFGGSRTRVALRKTGDLGVGAEGKTVDAALKKAVKVKTPAEVLLRTPHTLGASVVASDGGTVAYGGVRSVRFEGFSPEFFAATTSGSRAWRAQVVVKFGHSNRGVIFYGDYMSPVPETLTPILGYPSADATSMRVTIQDGLRTRTGTFDLTPDDSGEWSVYVARGLEAIELSATGAGAIVDVANADTEYGDMVAFSNIGDPLRLTRFAEVSGAVTALAPLKSADSAWEFGRSRYVGATRSGIYSIAVEQRSSGVAVKEAAGSGVANEGGLLSVGERVYCATAEGLKEIRSGHRKAEVLVAGAFESLAWDKRREELHVIGADRSVVWVPKHGGWYERPECKGWHGFNAGNHGFGIDSEGRLRDMESEDTAVATDIRMACDMEGDYEPISAVSIDCEGITEDGMVLVTDKGCSVMTLYVSGEIRSGIGGRVFWRGKRRLRVEVEMNGVKGFKVRV